MKMKRAFPGPQEAVEMDPETLAMCMLDRLICTPEDRRGELRYRDGFINHHVTHAFQERARELAMDGVVVTHSVDARAALPELADALLEAWAHLERKGYLIVDERRRRVLISRDGQTRHAAYRAGDALEPVQPTRTTDSKGDSRVASNAPTAIVLWAHTDPLWTDAERDSWRNAVLTLTHLLRANGVDADVDLFHEHEATDWSRFGPKRIKASRWIVIAVSEAWRRAFERENEPQSNAGAVGETNALRGMFAADQSDFESRVVLALLPGREISELPNELHATTPWTLVPSLTTEGIEDLLRILHAQPAYPKPTVGATPVLPPRPPVLGTSGVDAAEQSVPRREIDPPELMPDEYPTGTFNLHMRNGPLNAHLTNQGGSTAEIMGAKLSTFIGDFDGVMWIEEAAPLAPERKPTAELPRAGKLTICFGEGELEPLLLNLEPLRLSVRYRAAGRPELFEYTVNCTARRRSPAHARNGAPKSRKSS
jgi:hypothetical protein